MNKIRSKFTYTNIYLPKYYTRLSATTSVAIPYVAVLISFRLFFACPSTPFLLSSFFNSSLIPNLLSSLLLLIFSLYNHPPPTHTHITLKTYLPSGYHKHRNHHTSPTSKLRWSRSLAEFRPCGSIMIWIVTLPSRQVMLTPRYKRGIILILPNMQPLSQAIYPRQWVVKMKQEEVGGGGKK